MWQRHVAQPEESGSLVERKAESGHFPVCPDDRGHQLLALRLAGGTDEVTDEVRDGVRRLA
jgi:hypothetical protein